MVWGCGNMGNMGGYNEQYYPEQGGYGGYEGDGYEETDYDNLDEIDRVTADSLHWQFILPF